jgi:hypothetical protein
MIHRFGLPSFFITIAPDDVVHHTLAIRLCFPTTSNTAFPADPEGLLAALQEGAGALNRVYHIAEADLQRRAAGNPVAGPGSLDGSWTLSQTSFLGWRGRLERAVVSH